MPSRSSVDSTPLIQAIGLTHDFIVFGGLIRALSDVALTVMPGDAVFVLGTNGSGKTTLMKALAGEIVCRKGQVQMVGQSLHRLPWSHRTKILGRLSQRPQDNLCSTFTLDEMINLYHSNRIFSSAVKQLKEEMRNAGMSHTQRIGDLSGGQQQLLALRLVLSREPNLMLLDEPTSSLDFAHTELFVSILKDAIRPGSDRGLVYISHRVEEAIDLASKIIFLHSGKIIGQWDRGFFPTVSQFYQMYSQPHRDYLGERK
ncbi:MAG: ABC transporter ATP-binding protein [Nitrospirae bacterium]|nr:ABC transporter ATP-binding protein [Magnetococcales bacterium]HAT51446.1 hypothetical protein [Alphaproteobacteria bacterium]